VPPTLTVQGIVGTVQGIVGTSIAGPDCGTGIKIVLSELLVNRTHAPLPNVVAFVNTEDRLIARIWTVKMAGAAVTFSPLAFV
jgi:hypothetical protein